MMVMYTNNTRHIQHVGGKMIHPGETREVSFADLPSTPKPVGFDDLHDLSAQATGLPDLIAILKGSVAKVTLALPGLDDAQLDALADLESEDGDPRKGVIEAVEAEKLRRAAARLSAGGEA